MPMKAQSIVIGLSSHAYGISWRYMKGSWRMTVKVHGNLHGGSLRTTKVHGNAMAISWAFMNATAHGLAMIFEGSWQCLHRCMEIHGDS